MRLVSCHIENFGAICGRDIVFDKNLTCICRGNGEGKTTLAAFVKAMFYGLPTYRANTRTFDDRQRYYPFNGGKFGGSLTFESGGKTYRIVRIFDKKSGAGDELCVYDGVKKTDIFGENVGESVFGIDARSFEKTAFFGAEECDGATPDIAAKLNGTFLRERADSALAALDSERKYLKVRGGNGLLDRLAAEKREAESHLLRLEKTEMGLDALYRRRRELKERADELRAAEKRLGEQRLAAEKRANYDRYMRDIAALDGEEKDILARYPKGLPTDAEIAECARRAAIKSGNRTESGGRKGTEKPAKGGIYAAVFAVFALFGVAGAIVCAASVAAGIAVISLAVVGVAVSTLLHIGTKRNTVAADGSADGAYDVMAEKYGLRAETAAEIETVAADGRRVAAIRAQKESILRLAAGYGSELAQEPTVFVDTDPERELAEAARELAALDMRIADAEAETAQLPELRAQIGGLNEEIACAERRLKCIKAAAELIERADANIKERYVGPVRDAFLGYLEKVPAFPCDGTLMDENFTVYLERGGAVADRRHLSAGQLTVCNILLRLALIDNMYGGEKPFIIADDPFMSLDKFNFAAAAKTLCEFSESVQIIYLTCSEERKIGASNA